MGTTGGSRARAGAAPLAGVCTCVRYSSRYGWGLGSVGIGIVGKNGHSDTFDGFVVEGRDWGAVCVTPHHRAFFGFANPKGLANRRPSKATTYRPGWWTLVLGLGHWRNCGQVVHAEWGVTQKGESSKPNVMPVSSRCCELQSSLRRQNED